MNSKRESFEQKEKDKRTTWNFRKGSRISEYVKIGVNIIDYISSHEFLQSYLMIETQIIVTFET